MAKKAPFRLNIINILAGSFQKPDIFFSQSCLTYAKFHVDNPLICIVALGGMVLFFELIPTAHSSQECKSINEVSQAVVSARDIRYEGRCGCVSWCKGNRLAARRPCNVDPDRAGYRSRDGHTGAAF